MGTSFLLLASDGGAPAPRTSCGSPCLLLLASDGGAPAPRTSCGSPCLIARLGRRGPRPADVLRLALPHRSPRTAGPQARGRPAAHPASSHASDGGALTAPDRVCISYACHG